MGKCPHCGSRNIRRRYREHGRYKWRCRSCNRVFRAPKRGVVVWLGVAVVVIVVAAFFAVQQGIIVLPSTPAQLEESVDQAEEVVIPTATSVEPIATLTTTLHSVSTRVADNAPKVQATIDANARPTTKTVSTAISATSTPISTATPTPRPSATPTVAHTPTPIPPPHLRHIDEKQYMLELINTERKKAGVPPVELGNNNAAQLHAESALENCFGSHWGVDGLKPYMRYSLAGGYQGNGENGHGIDYCIKSNDGYASIGPVKGAIQRAMKGWMNSPDHVGTVLDKRSKKVNIGLAWDKYNFKAYQHFEGDYVEYDELPSIENGILYLSGKTKNGAKFDNYEDLGALLFYDPPPHILTSEAVSKTYAYCFGVNVAGFLWPLSGGLDWGGISNFDSDYTSCPNDPYRTTYDKNLKADWIIAKRWIVTDKSFLVEADISKVLEKYGEGVYSVMLWGDIDGERAVISEYSIFHGVTPPDTYKPR